MFMLSVCATTDNLQKTGENVDACSVLPGRGAVPELFLQTTEYVEEDPIVLSTLASLAYISRESSPSTTARATTLMREVCTLQ
jgi:hypothetical protein